MNYTKGELTGMMKALGAGEENDVLASRVYATKSPERRRPQVKCF